MKKHFLISMVLFSIPTLIGLLVGVRPVTATPPAAPGAWWGDYFDNPDLSGAPVLSRYDDAIKFSWGDDSPLSTST